MAFRPLLRQVSRRHDRLELLSDALQRAVVPAMAALSATAIFAPRPVYAEERQEDYSVRNSAARHLRQIFCRYKIPRHVQYRPY